MPKPSNKLKRAQEPIVRDCAPTRVWLKLPHRNQRRVQATHNDKHPDRQLDLYAKAIEHQGWRRAVVVSKRSGFIVTGHGAVETAKRMGWPVVPVDYQDFNSAEDERAHLLADNRLPELAQLSQSDVVALLKELYGKIALDLTGFDSEVLASLEGFSVECEIDAPTLRLIAPRSCKGNGTAPQAKSGSSAITG